MADSEGGGCGGCIFLLAFIAAAFVFGPELFDAIWLFLENEFGLQSHFWLWIFSLCGVIAAFKVAASVIGAVIGLVFFGTSVFAMGFVAVIETIEEIWSK